MSKFASKQLPITALFLAPLVLMGWGLPGLFAQDEKALEGLDKGYRAMETFTNALEMLFCHSGPVTGPPDGDSFSTLTFRWGEK